MNDLHISPKPVLSLLRRFHFVVFIVLIAIILSAAILLLYGVVNKASGENSTPQTGITSNFDQETIDQIWKLKKSNEAIEQLDLSQGRINPFSE